MRAWGLSARERDVASLAIGGLPSQNIGAALFISPHTVRDHIKSVFAKDRRELPPRPGRHIHRAGHRPGLLVKAVTIARSEPASARTTPAWPPADQHQPQVAALSACRAAKHRRGRGAAVVPARPDRPISW